jgi:hypothetical protein
MTKKQLSKDALVKKFLHKHADEFSKASFLDDTVVSKDYFVAAREQVADLLAGLKLDDPVQQRIRTMWLAGDSIARIAKRVGIPRPDVWFKVQALKRKALRRWRMVRDEITVKTAIGLECPPELAAQATQQFEYLGRTATVYLIVRDDNRIWVDAAGKAFHPQIQELLNDLPPLEHMELV